jgi:HPt (histidine-containing phosphotransfer) domain-containing protein
MSILVADCTEAVDAAVLADLEEMQEEGGPSFVAELIGLYLEDAPRKLAQMRASARAADDAALRRAAHGLKGSSSNLGAFGVAAVCVELERACDSSGQTTALLARLAREMERAHLAFERERRRRYVAA